MEKARNQKLMRRLACQIGQAAQEAARQKENNPHIDLNRAVKANTELAARRFAKRELRPIILRRQLKEETDRIMEEVSMRNKGGGCWDTRGNKISCPMRYRSYEAITSIKRAVFDDYGQFLREESINSIGMGDLNQTPSFRNHNTAPMMRAYNPDRPVSGPLFHRWARSSNFIESLLYDALNDAFQIVQIFDFDLIPGEINPLTDKRTNINLDGTANYHSINGFVNTAARVVPFARGAKPVAKLMPRGFGYVKKMNAPAFSTTFKGTLSKLSPKLRGYSNRLMNKFIDSYNGQVSEGMILLKTVQLKSDDDTE